MCFSAASSSENDQGSMNLASNTAPLASIIPSRVAPIQRLTGWRTCRCTCVTVLLLLRSYQCRLRASVAVPRGAAIYRWASRLTSSLRS